ncbi:MAG: hypothetical protein R6W90_07605 [Ignavibacteriaceae bacterium]
MFTSVAQVKSEGNFSDTIEDRVFEPHIIKAVIELKKILTPAKYAEIEALNHNEEAFTSCAIAEANLAVAYALPSLNMETQGSGVVKIRGWDQSRSELLDQDEIAKRQKHYRSVAMDIIKAYIPKDLPDGEISGEEIRGADYRLSAL